MPKIIDHESRRREVAEAVLEVIAREGISGATVRRIAETSGWSTGVLAHYFDDKEEIVSFALDHLVETMSRRIDACEGKAGREGLLCLMEAGLPLDEARVFEARVWFTFFGPALVREPLADRIRNLHGAYRHLVVERIRECQVASEIDPAIDPAAFALTLLAAVDGISLHALFQWDAWPAEAQVEAIERILSTGRPGPRSSG